MIKSTPHPPTHSPDTVTVQTAFGLTIGDNRLFSVQPDVDIEAALTLACEHLACAAAVAYEAADNAAQEFRPLARAAVHQVEAAKALVEASLAGLSDRPSKVSLVG